MKRFFERESSKVEGRIPRPSVLPYKPDLNVSALYRGSRIGGDYFDFLVLNDTRLLFLLSDIAGKREEALSIAASVQEMLWEEGPRLLSAADANVSDAVTELTLELNRTILHAAGGVHPAPTFLGCLDEQFGMLHYVSAGHTPAFVKGAGEIVELDPTGLPLGLFSHATHDAQVSVVPSGASVVLVSKGLVEIVAADRQEFGIDRVKKLLQEGTYPSAQELCQEVLGQAVRFSEQPSAFGPRFSIPGFRESTDANDLTVVCIMRTVQAAVAVSA